MPSEGEFRSALLCASSDYDENTLWDAHEDGDEYGSRVAAGLTLDFHPSPSEREAFGNTDTADETDSTPEPSRGHRTPETTETPWWRLACRHRLLTAVEEKQLASRIQAGDDEALIQLVESNYRLVIRIAGRYQRLRSQAMTLEDLFQEGCIGLMHAARKFDPKRGVRFSTYAVPWVQQCMARSIMRQERLVRLPEGMEREQQAVERMVGHLTQTLGRRPAPTELAGSLGESSRKLLTQPVNFDFVSLDAPISTQVESDSWADILPDEYTDTASDAIDRTTREVMRKHINRALSGLTQQQALVIRLRYGFDQAPLTLAAIAAILGITPERVRQLERTALRNMRRSEHLAQLQHNELEIDEE